MQKKGEEEGRCSCRRRSSAELVAGEAGPPRSSLDPHQRSPPRETRGGEQRECSANVDRFRETLAAFGFVACSCGCRERAAIAQLEPGSRAKLKMAVPIGPGPGPHVASAEPGPEASPVNQSPVPCINWAWPVAGVGNQTHPLPSRATVSPHGCASPLSASRASYNSGCPCESLSDRRRRRNRSFFRYAKG